MMEGGRVMRIQSMGRTVLRWLKSNRPASLVEGKVETVKYKISKYSVYLK